MKLSPSSSRRPDTTHLPISLLLLLAVTSATASVQHVRAQASTSESSLLNDYPITQRKNLEINNSEKDILSSWNIIRASNIHDMSITANPLGGGGAPSVRSSQEEKKSTSWAETEPGKTHNEPDLWNAMEAMVFGGPEPEDNGIKVSGGVQEHPQSTPSTSSALPLDASAPSSDVFSTSSSESTPSLPVAASPNTTPGAQIQDSVLRVHFPKGSFAQSQSGSVGGGVNFYAQPFDTGNFTSAYLAYDVAFPANFTWAHGGKLPGLYGGEPDGACNGGNDSDQCFSARFMWREKGAGEVYMYLPAQKRDAFCQKRHVSCADGYGQSIGRGQINLDPGKWTRMEMFMQMNEASSSNGILAVAVDGVKVLEEKRMPWRSNAEVSPSSIMFSSFFGGHDSSYATPVDQDVFFRNVVMAVDNKPVTASAHKSISGWGACAPWLILASAWINWRVV